MSQKLTIPDPPVWSDYEGPRGTVFPLGGTCGHPGEHAALCPNNSYVGGTSGHFCHCEQPLKCPGVLSYGRAALAQHLEECKQLGAPDMTKHSADQILYSFARLGGRRVELRGSTTKKSPPHHLYLVEWTVNWYNPLIGFGFGTPYELLTRAGIIEPV